MTGEITTSIAVDSADPLGEAMTFFLYSRKRETAGLDFKLTIDTRRGSDFAKVVKDYFAFANSGGGYLVLGFRQLPSGRYEPVGLPPGYHIDQAELQEKFNAYSTEPLALGYREDERLVDGAPRRFAIIYFPPAPRLIRPSKDAVYQDGDGHTRVGAKQGTVYVRRGTQSIPASRAEEESAESLLAHANYRISLISGRPDHLKESLFTDLLPIGRLPARIYCAELRNVPSEDWAPDLSAFVRRGKQIFSFDDPEETSLARDSRLESVASYERDDFRLSPDGARISAELLKWELVGHAASLGMGFDERRARLFYPLEAGRDSRVVSWRGLSREAKRKVVSKQYSPSLHGQVYLHLAVTPTFLRIEESEYLRLQPGFLFTTDGRSPIYGRAQGLALTSIENSARGFNLGYLRGVLFWAGQLSDNSASIAIRPDLQMSRDPIRTEVSIGLRSDVVGLPKITSDESLPPGADLEE
ncbi:MAG: AlbA family DNA-binding domain-containing protein [Acidiferrobacteraceae bacterium]